MNGYIPKFIKLTYREREYRVNETSAEQQNPDNNSNIPTEYSYTLKRFILPTLTCLELYLKKNTIKLLATFPAFKITHNTIPISYNFMN